MITILVVMLLKSLSIDIIVKGGRNIDKDGPKFEVEDLGTLVFFRSEY